MAVPSVLSLIHGSYPSPSFPPHDSQVLTYLSATNNVGTIQAYIGGTGGRLVGTLTFTYVSGGVAADDNVQTIVLTVP